ncbi:MAG: O-methyltransferase [Actinobacteria bacterium]|nr:O-methyltransferase [Actinomycetota bacterium]MBI3687970.1 O-methyltransferase [Actinomycetota bacterium]
MAETPVVSIRGYVETFLPEDQVLVAARARATDLGCRPLGAAAGATLRFLATLLAARAVVEVGTGTGVSGLYLLRGMRPTGVLTTVDIEPEHSRAARRAFAEDGVPTHRARLINGAALEVLPRLTDAAYDLVFCATVGRDFNDYLEEALRLLRPGGVVVFGNALWRDRVADPSARDPDTVAVRDLGRIVRDRADLVPVLLPVSDGLLAAAYQP